jgi:hypothetical protein
MRAEIREQVTEILANHRGDERVIVVFSSSFRKRLALALQIWILNDTTPETKPAILDEFEPVMGSIDWMSFITSTDPTAVFDTFNTIPNGNSAADSVQVLGVWSGFLVVALPNGGEKHLPGLGPLDEARNKAAEEQSVVLRELFGDTVLAVGMDAVITRAQLEAGDVVGETKILGKPTGHDVRLSTAEDAEYLELVREYVEDVIGADTLVQLQNVAAMVVRRLEVVRGVLVEQEVSAIEYISLVITITQELLAEVIGKLNREAAGFQLVQWLLIAQGRWDDFSEVAMVGVHESFTNNSERQCTDFLAACEVLGVSLSVLLKLVDLIHPGEIAGYKWQV